MTKTFTITLKNCAFFARHGALESEEELGQRFFVDIEMVVAPTRPLDQDDLEGTVDYGVVFSVAEQIVERERFNLIEALADRIGNAVCEQFESVELARITVRKPSVPIAGILDYAEVCVECTPKRS